ncbi:MAG TPA: DUF434 domain-containing protein [Clostridia bacterium]|nr:DUF434 domain-containing protein [Clostridia bacterium]
MVETSSKHRGPDPEDERSFGTGRISVLCEATGDLCWLLDRGYGIASATELVGDRYHLTRRQRIAIARCACSRAAQERRSAHCIPPSQLRGQELWLDGLNVLTILEVAFGGGVILIGRDECCRDVAGVYSRYHKVAETIPALEAIGQFATQYAVSKCRWWLDSPVNNSGRLKDTIQKVAAESGWLWEVELVTNPDKVLSACDQVVASSDHAILDRCQQWVNLVRYVLIKRAPAARVVDLRLKGNVAAVDGNAGISA